MKKKLRGIALLIVTCFIFTGAFSACSKQNIDGNNTNQDTNTGAGDTAGQTTKDLSGTITMAGSTSMEKLANVVAEAFMNKYQKVIISPEFIGSGAGIEAVLAGTVNIGNSSRSLTDSEKASGAVENIVAIDGIAVILDKENSVTNLSKEQLVGIYTGTITNWSAVGGVDQPIVVVGRESGSGTRGAFEELLAIADKCKYSNVINSTGGVMAKVSSTPGAIGYVSLDVLDDTVIAVNVNDVAPTVENIKAGSYMLNRPFVMTTVGEISTQSQLVQTFFEYLKSTDGKELIKSVGLITVD